MFRSEVKRTFLFGFLFAFSFNTAFAFGYDDYESGDGASAGDEAPPVNTPPSSSAYYYQSSRGMAVPVDREATTTSPAAAFAYAPAARPQPVYEASAPLPPLPVQVAEPPPAVKPAVEEPSPPPPPAEPPASIRPPVPSPQPLTADRSSAPAVQIAQTPPEESVPLDLRGRGPAPISPAPISPETVSPEAVSPPPVSPAQEPAQAETPQYQYKPQNQPASAAPSFKVAAPLPLDRSQAPDYRPGDLAPGANEGDEENERLYGSFENPESYGIYVSLSGGLIQRESASAAELFEETRIGSGTVQIAPGTQHADFDVGPAAGGALGYRFSQNFRVEGEVGYSSYRLSQVSPQTASIPQLNGTAYKTVSGDDMQRVSFLVNGYLDIPTGTALAPFIGGGLGWVHNIGASYLLRNSTGALFEENFGDTDAGLAMLEAGITINLDDNWSIAPNYRYLHYFAEPNRLGDETDHLFRMTVTYQF